MDALGVGMLCSFCDRLLPNLRNDEADVSLSSSASSRSRLSRASNEEIDSVSVSVCVDDLMVVGVNSNTVLSSHTRSKVPTPREREDSSSGTASTKEDGDDGINNVVGFFRFRENFMVVV
jgi:hypothetical protein